MKIKKEMIVNTKLNLLAFASATNVICWTTILANAKKKVNK